jgi:hypothetical protein
MTKELASVVVFCLSFLIPACAIAAPSELKGNSVVLRWTENRVQRYEGESAFRSVSVNLEMSVYVSTQGRVFNKMTSNSGSSEQVAGRASQSAQRIPSFSGRTMTIMQPLQGLARRITVNFDGGFTTCAVSVILAKQSGVGSGFMKAFGTRRLQEIQSSTVNSTSCAVRAGNVFE